MPSAFDGIPEDEIQSWPCPECVDGSVTYYEMTGYYECDKCEFYKEPVFD